MKDWKPYIGQEVVCLIDAWQMSKGDTFIVKGVKVVCCNHHIDIGMECPITQTFQCTCDKKGIFQLVKGEPFWPQAMCFAPVDQYSISAIKELASQIVIGDTADQPVRILNN